MSVLRVYMLLVPRPDLTRQRCITRRLTFLRNSNSFPKVPFFLSGIGRIALLAWKACEFSLLIQQNICLARAHQNAASRPIYIVIEENVIESLRELQVSSSRQDRGAHAIRQPPRLTQAAALPSPPPLSPRIQTPLPACRAPKTRDSRACAAQPRIRSPSLHSPLTSRQPACAQRRPRAHIAPTGLPWPPRPNPPPPPSASAAASSWAPSAPSAGLPHVRELFCCPRKGPTARRRTAAGGHVDGLDDASVGMMMSSGISIGASTRASMAMTRVNHILHAHVRAQCMVNGLTLTRHACRGLS